MTIPKLSLKNMDYTKFGLRKKRLRVTLNAEVKYMSASARRFPYEKAVVLNVLYDALDAIDLRIDKSNSMRGMLLVSSKATANGKMRIVISPSLSEETSLVEIFPENVNLESNELITILFDEMNALIQRAGIGK